MKTLIQEIIEFTIQILSVEKEIWNKYSGATKDLHILSYLLCYQHNKVIKEIFNRVKIDLNHRYLYEINYSDLEKICEHTIKYAKNWSFS